MCYFIKRRKVLDSLRNNFRVIENQINEVVPCCASILKNKDWKKIQNRYIDRFACIDHGNTIISSSAFIDIIIIASNKDPLAMAVIYHVKECVKKISLYVESHPQFKSAFQNILRNMIMSFDQDVCSTNNDFKNWISELSVFTYLCQSPHEIIAIEKPLGNGKSADFSCKISGSQEQYTFDVVTYQNIDPSLHQTSESMNEFLNKRISEKYSHKMQNISQDDHPEFRILPILEYKTGMEKFSYSVDSSKSLPAMVYFANTIDGKTEFCLMLLNDLCSELRTRTQG